MQLLVSILVPTYNAQEWIADRFVPNLGDKQVVSLFRTINFKTSKMV
jgi:hypothetical protein